MIDKNYLIKADNFAENLHREDFQRKSEISDLFIFCF